MFCVAGYGIAQGTGNGRYSPAGQLTKGRTATFLCGPGTSPATTYRAGADHCRGTAGVHEDNVEALMDVGVVPPGECVASTRISRAQMAAWPGGHRWHRRSTGRERRR